MPGDATIDAVLPLARRDTGRARILLHSLEHFAAPLGRLWVVVPDADLEWIQGRVLRLPSMQVVAESELIPQLDDGAPRPDGWFIQQLLKLAIADRVGSEFYLTLDADVICVRRFDVAELVVDGRAVSNRRTGPRFEPDWYDWAARVLDLPPSDYVHGVTPALLSATAVAGLQEHLIARTGGGDWRSYLLGAVPWTEYVLYFTWLEALGIYDRFHFPGPHGADTIYGNSIWLPDQDLATWDAEAMFGGDVPYQFAVVQSNHPTITTADVVERIGPLIGLKD